MLCGTIVLVLQKLANTDPFHTADDYSVIHYTDVDDVFQSDIRCPFCDFEIQVPLLCSDLEEEYCSSLNNVV